MSELRLITVNDVGDKMPDLSTLPKRMRYAATVVEEARREYHNRPNNLNSNWVANAWDPTNLRHHADEFEADDRTNDELINELAPLLSVICDEAVAKDRGYVYVARRLAEFGWTKGDPA